jgi:hypothetical protein
MLRSSSEESTLEDLSKYYALMGKGCPHYRVVPTTGIKATRPTTALIRKPGHPSKKVGFLLSSPTE